MRDLLECYQQEKSTLPQEAAKRFAPFLRKIGNDAYGLSAKNIEKLREVSDDKSIIDFIIVKLEDYQTRPDIKEVFAHYDYQTLMPSWCVLIMSKEPKANRYLETLVDRYLKQDHPLFLDSLYWLFGLFPDNEFAASLCDKITAYYKMIRFELSAYRWAEKIGLQLPEISPNYWSISLYLTTDGESFCFRELTDAEEEMRFTLSIEIFRPGTHNQTFEIQIENEARTVSIRAFEYEKGWFVDHKQSIPFECDLCNLHDFISAVEARFGINFDTENIASIRAPKGIDKKVVKKWVERKFR